MKYVSKIIFLFFLIFSFNAYAITNCKTCGSDGAFGKELGTIYPSDPFFYNKNFNLSCVEKNGKSWNNRLSGYFNSNYVFAFQNRRNQVILFIGYLTEDKKKLKLKGIKKYKPKNLYDNYRFLVRLNGNIDDTLNLKIRGSNRKN